MQEQGRKKLSAQRHEYIPGSEPPGTPGAGSFLRQILRPSSAHRERSRRYLLTHPEFAPQLGKNGHEHVKESLLITANVRRWLLLFRILSGLVVPDSGGEAAVLAPAPAI
jgi:hypothetical protein